MFAVIGLLGWLVGCVLLLLFDLLVGRVCLLIVFVLRVPVICEFVDWLWGYG